jgi:hypothetical protein
VEENAVKSLHNRWKIAAQSFNSRCAINERLLCNGWKLAGKSLENRCAIAVQSLRNR